MKFALQQSRSNLSGVERGRTLLYKCTPSYGKQFCLVFVSPLVSEVKEIAHTFFISWVHWRPLKLYVYVGTC